MANGEQIIGTDGAFLFNTAGERDICESCCGAVTFTTCGCCTTCGAGSGDNTTFPRMLVTLSWTESAWASSHTYLGHEIITVTVSSVDYLFIKQNAASGISGGSQPTWDLTVGNTTTDNTVTWERIIDAYEHDYLGCGYTNGLTLEVCAKSYQMSGHLPAGSTSTSWYYHEQWKNTMTNLDLGKLRLDMLYNVVSSGTTNGYRSVEVERGGLDSYSVPVPLVSTVTMHMARTRPTTVANKSSTVGLSTHIPTSVLQLNDVGSTVAGPPPSGPWWIDSSQEGQITTDSGLTIAWVKQTTTTVGRKRWRVDGGGTV